MKNLNVYDLPTRIFHGLFALGFIVAFGIAKALDDESSAYPYHMLIGMTLAFLVMLRIIWGWIGSKYARFSSFALHPARLNSYFTQMLKGKTQREAGHNPASSWAALIMMTLALGLAATGYGMTAGLGEKDFFEELHELFAHLFLFTALAHIGGLLFHTLRHRDGIALSMITGKKAPIAGAQGIPHNSPAAALLMIGLVLGFAGFLMKNYDTNRQVLSFGGTTLQLGENEGEKDSESTEETHSYDED